MNGYDFDKTILNGDSTLRFYFYCLPRYPILWLNLFYQIFVGLEYLFRIINKTKYKQKFYSFLKYVKDIDFRIEKFWDRQEKNIYEYYLKQKKENDVIISASPEFLLKPIINRINPSATLIASRVDKITGKYTGINCWGKEKVERFRAVFRDIKLNSFYSDSMSDKPMFLLAKDQFLVSKKEIKQIKLSS